MTSAQQLILDVLSAQSDGYLCSPVASAFVAVGLENGAMVEEELIGLQDEGLTEFWETTEELTMLKIERDENGEPVLDDAESVKLILDDEGKPQTEVVPQIVDAGWVITDKGREALKDGN